MDRRWLFTAPLATLAALGVAYAPRLWAVTPPPTEGAPPPHEVVAEGVTFAAELDRERTDPLSREVRVHVSLTGASMADDRHVPTDLVVVVDRSGSMSGQKMEDARAATAALIRSLRPEDRVALVSFAGAATVDLPLAHPRDQSWVGVVGRLREGGSTNLQDGLAVAQTQARVEPGRAARMVVLSDGRPDQPWGMLAPVVGDIVGHDVPVTAVGIGEDWDESMMRQLADAGTGNLHWVHQGPDLERVLASELDSAARVVAQSTSLRVDGAATVIGAAGYPVDGREVQVGSIVAGVERGLWLTLRLEGEAPGVVDPGEIVLSMRTPAGALVEHRVDLPPVVVEADAAVAFASLGDGWANGVVQESWNEAQQRVAMHTQAGDDEAALGVLRDYQAQMQLRNGYANNPIVSDNMVTAAALEAELRAVLGSGDAALRNDWSKTTTVGSTRARKR